MVNPIPCLPSKATPEKRVAANVTGCGDEVKVLNGDVKDLVRAGAIPVPKLLRTSGGSSEDTSGRVDLLDSAGTRVRGRYRL
jgi:hypothetical protein